MRKLLTVLASGIVIFAACKSRRNASVTPHDQAADSEKKRLAAQFVVAEYNTMMAKVHLWMTLQYTGMSLVIVALTLLARLGQTVKVEVLLWSAAIVIVVAYIAYQGAMLEGLRAVLHVERELRPRAQALVGSANVFRWEPILRATRKPNPGHWAYIPPVLSLAAGASLAMYRRLSWNNLDSVGITAVLVGTAVVAYLTWQGREIDAQITIAAQL